ncbi:hypothetical protein MRB53_014259 [Persea americana]|uniref:Uncharacterized protein n=1 Tax=Persea americana TaxID=3435 RepID=A0ACC2KAY7_PERAE|nr:hypothetical protein MRB53_014259 [Persea americana]
MGATRDLISNLPDAILHYILSLLPIKSSIQTSVLSSTWRYHWTSIPHLDFDREFWISTPTLDFDDELESGIGRVKFVSIVDQILALHAGTKLQRFRIFFHPGLNYSSITEKWIHFATRNEVEELNLNFHMYGGKPFALPQFVFDCKSVSVLKLTSCIISSFVTFKNLRLLKTLYLRMVNLTIELIDSLLSNCLILESLDMIQCSQPIHLKISSMNLKLKSLVVIMNYEANLKLFEIDGLSLVSFKYCGEFVDISFKDSSSLVDVMIDYNGPLPLQVPPFDTIKPLLGLSHIKTLTLSSEYLEYIHAEDGALQRSFVLFPNLKQMYIVSTFMTRDNLPCFISFSQNCPLLEELYIDHLDSQDEDEDVPLYEEEYEMMKNQLADFKFCHLKTVKIEYFMGIEYELWWMKFLLEKAVVLESLILIYPSKYKEGTLEYMEKLLWFYEQLLSMEMAYSRAKVIVSSCSDDCNGLSPLHAV